MKILTPRKPKCWCCSKEAEQTVLLRPIDNDLMSLCAACITKAAEALDLMVTPRNHLEIPFMPAHVPHPHDVHPLTYEQLMNMWSPLRGAPETTIVCGERTGASGGTIG